MTVIIIIILEIERPCYFYKMPEASVDQVFLPKMIKDRVHFLALIIIILIAAI